jgi:hypothetical protein
MTAAALAHVLLASAALAAPLPPERPAETGPAAVEAAPSASVGIICRDPRLLGDARPDIIDVGNLACGIDDPVRVMSIDKISFSEPILTGCRTARRLADWLTGVARIEARAQLGTGIAEVQVMGSYACRTQNNAGRWRSEHARGRAVDIGGFTMTNGSVVSVADDWGKGPEGEFLRAIWQKGCGPFATVLGPEADRHHRDHFHLDTSPRGGEPHCR